MIGKIVANYRIETLIGKGGMSNVYLAEHLHIKRKVAIKVLHNNLLKDVKIRKRFKNEAFALSELDHPNIVKLYDYIEIDNHSYLIMEFIEGLTLDDYINKVSGPITNGDLISLFSQILEGVKYAHNKGIIHRDIKPSNFIVTNNNHIKILDFGISKILDSDDFQLTKVGSKLGTVLYMSPEQVKGVDVSIQSDIYSLGVTLFQMSTGSCPYNKQSSEYEVYDKIVNEPLPILSEFYVGVDNGISNLVQKATQKKTSNRYKDCDEFLQSLLKANKKERIISTDFSAKHENISGNLVDNTVSSDQFNGKRILSAIIDALIPVIYILILLFYRDIEYENTTYFNMVSWSWNKPYFESKEIVMWLQDQFVNSSMFILGPLKGIASLIFLLWIVAELVLPIIIRKSLGMLIIGLTFSNSENQSGYNFVNYVLLRNLPYIFLIFILIISLFAKSFYLLIITTIVLFFYWLTDHLSVLLTNKSIGDIISHIQIKKDT